ncbi:MAG: tetratricopeptide repeat protein [Bacteroidetes bacterium]|nr:MAG: tetratricopeptide repeat protein [Bacteroidota bacterium]
MKLLFVIGALLSSIAIFCQSNAQDSASLLSDSSVKLWKLGDYKNALAVINRSLNIARKTNDSLQIAKCLNNTGLIYISIGDPVKSIFYYEQSLKILRVLPKSKDFPTSLLNIGIAYKEQGIYDKALNYLFESVGYFEEWKDAKKQSSAYNAIGNISRIEKNYQKSLEYHFKALKLRESINYTEGIAGSLNSIGVVYKELEKYDSALIFLQESIKKAAKGNSPTEHLANTLSHIGSIYVKNKNFNYAKKYYDSAYRIRRSVNSKKGIAYSMLELGELNYVSKDFKQAEKYLLLSIKSAEEVNASDVLLKCYTILRKLYKETKNYIKAIEYDDLFIILNEQVLGEEKLKSLTQMQIKYETERKQDEIENLSRDKKKREAELLAQELQLQSKKVHTRNLVIVIILLSSILVLVLILFRIRNRFANRLDMVMREMHHRVKNNFQVLLSIFNLQLDHIKDKESKEFIRSNCNRITAMMLIHRELYFDKEITTVKVSDYIQTLVENLLTAYELRKRQIDIRYEIDESISLNVDNAISMGLLINELVTNSFKYAFGADNLHPVLTIILTKLASSHTLIVKDNASDSDKVIFNKSFGLKLVETQVKLLKGEMKRFTSDGVEYRIIF